MTIEIQEDATLSWWKRTLIGKRKMCLHCGKRYDALLQACPKCEETKFYMNGGKHAVIALETQQESDKYNKEGLMYANSQQYSLAESMFKKAIDKNPRNAVVYFNLGVLCLAQDKKKSAMRWAKKALRMRPHYKSARELLEEAKKRTT